jgi:hypothetical protein
MEGVFIPHHRRYFAKAALLDLVEESGLGVTVFLKMGYPLGEM